MARTMPDDAEAGGDLMLAVIQLAIMLGAGRGGLLFDGFGYAVAFIGGGLVLAGSALFAETGARPVVCMIR